jgi:hypothetical protein
MSIHFNNFFKISLFTFIKLYYFDKLVLFVFFYKKIKIKSKQYFEGRKSKKG